MNWKTIRLELASTPEYPAGSASRAYLIRLPLDDLGVVDDAALAMRPGDATVRRFWPSEPDRSGFVERNESGWMLHCNGGRNEPTTSTLEGGPLCMGTEVMIVEADGKHLPFRVAGVSNLRGAS